jgi:hypothetical protein
MGLCFDCLFLRKMVHCYRFAILEAMPCPPRSMLFNAETIWGQLFVHWEKQSLSWRISMLWVRGPMYILFSMLGIVFPLVGSGNGAPADSGGWIFVAARRSASLEPCTFPVAGGTPSIYFVACSCVASNRWRAPSSAMTRLFRANPWLLLQRRSILVSVKQGEQLWDRRLIFIVYQLYNLAQLSFSDGILTLLLNGKGHERKGCSLPLLTPDKRHLRIAAMD